MSADIFSTKLVLRDFFIITLSLIIQVLSLIYSFISEYAHSIYDSLKGVGILL